MNQRAAVAPHCPKAGPVEILSCFAGWFIREGDKVALVVASTAPFELAQTHLARIGLERFVGGYVGVVPAKGARIEVAAMVRFVLRR